MMETKSNKKNGWFTTVIIIAVVAIVIFGVVSGPGTTGDGYYESCVVTFEGNQM